MIAELGAKKPKKKGEFLNKRKRSNTKLMNNEWTYKQAADESTTRPSSSGLNSAYLPKDRRYYTEHSSYNDTRSDSQSTSHFPKEQPNYQTANTNHLYTILGN